MSFESQFAQVNSTIEINTQVQNSCIVTTSQTGADIKKLKNCHVLINLQVADSNVFLRIEGQQQLALFLFAEQIDSNSGMDAIKEVPAHEWK
ncbi:unnamed protein product [Urochloa humidicola]